MRLALYARAGVTGETLDEQLAALRQWAEAGGGAVIGEYTDSGGTLRRPGFARLLADARRGRVEALVVWKLDRLGRSRIHDLLSRGVEVVSVTEPHTWRRTSPPRGTR